MGSPDPPAGLHAPMEPPRAGPAPAPAPTEGSGDCWLAAPSRTASTNWKVSRGTLLDSICFETSASILEEGGGEDVGAVSVFRGLLLTRPAGQESAPCEITICFKKRHEIHRIYVQSTARVYEVYYASEWQDRDNEYLCTVRCGASEKEVFLPRCDSGKAVVDSSSPSEEVKDSSSPSEEVNVKMTTCESNTSSEEDGWVEVKIPNSPLLGEQHITFPPKPDRNVMGKSQICYEATAEISDASPCTSLILRLLSVQTKDCIHIEEIYIYADPVESTDSDFPPSVTGSMAENSLLAMLVPSVLQLSKAGSSKVQDRAVSSNPSVQKPELDASMVTKEMDSQITRAELRETFTTVVEKEQVLAQTMLNERMKKDDSDFPSQHHVLDSVPAKGDITHDHLEKILDELVSRVGSIEASLSRFEDNILKPLTCIDTRLQRVEQQLDALSSRSASSKPFQCSRFSAPEFQVDDCDSDGGSEVAGMVKEDATVDSPDLVKEDTTVNSPSVIEGDATIDDQNVEDMPGGNAVSSFADGVMFVPASGMCPGLFIKAPDFVNEEDEHVSRNDISEAASLSCPKAKAFSSIDDALSSALKAFMLSTSTNPQRNDISSVLESQSSNVAVDYPMLAEIVGTCETSKMSGFNETDGVCSTNVDRRSEIMFKEDEGQQMCHQKWHWDSFGGLAMDDASETDEDENGSRKATDNDSNIDEAPNEFSNLKRTCWIWKDSSSDSNFDENVNENHQNKNLLDENSTDSENEPHTLLNWLSGHQGDYRFQEASFLGTMDWNEMNTEVSDKSVRCNQNASKVEIQKALNSCQNNTEDSEESLRYSHKMSKEGFLMSLNSSEDAEVLDPSLNEGSSLLDVQFVQREKSNYAFQLDGLMKDMLDSETELSDWLTDIGKREHFHSPLLETAQADAPVAVNDPFIGFEVTVKNSEFRIEGSSNEQLFSSLI